MNSSNYYNGQLIKLDAEMICLTDLWKVSGGVNSQSTSIWIRSDKNKRFISAVQESLNLKKNKVLETRAGRGGGTYAHWQIALAYAQYLNHDLHIWCNQLIHDYTHGKLEPKRQDIPQTYSEALRLAADLSDNVDRLEKKSTQQVETIQRLEPKARAFDKAVDPTALFSVGAVAKMYRHLGQQQLFELLRKQGYLQKSTDWNLPYQRHVESGYFHVKINHWEHPTKGRQSTPRPMITGKGIALIGEVLAKMGYKKYDQENSLF